MANQRVRLLGRISNELSDFITTLQAQYSLNDAEVVYLLSKNIQDLARLRIDNEQELDDEAVPRVDSQDRYQEKQMSTHCTK